MDIKGIYCLTLPGSSADVRKHTQKVLRALKKKIPNVIHFQNLKSLLLSVISGNFAFYNSVETSLISFQ